MTEWKSDGLWEVRMKLMSRQEDSWRLTTRDRTTPHRNTTVDNERLTDLDRPLVLFNQLMRACVPVNEQWNLSVVLQSMLTVNFNIYITTYWYPGFQHSTYIQTPSKNILHTSSQLTNVHTLARPATARASDSTFYTRLCARYKLLYCIVLYCIVGVFRSQQQYFIVIELQAALLFNT